MNLNEKKLLLSSSIIEITYNCNYECIHCSYGCGKSKNNNKFLSLDEIKNYCFSDYVTITGGEPLMHPQFKEIIDFLYKNNKKIILQTNASLFDEKLLNFVKERIFQYTISLNANNENLYDKISGSKNNFNKVINNINFLGNKVITTTIANKYNIDYFQEIIPFLNSLNCSTNMLAMIVDNGNDYKNNCVVSYTRFLEEVLKASYTKYTTIYDVPRCIIYQYKKDLEKKEKIKIQYCNYRQENIHTEKCKDCLYTRLCTGINKNYLEEIGDDEIKAIHRI